MIPPGAGLIHTVGNNTYWLQIWSTVCTLCTADRMLKSLQGRTVQDALDVANADLDDLLKYCDLVAILVSTKDSYCSALLEVRGILVGASKQLQTCVEQKSLEMTQVILLHQDGVLEGKIAWQWTGNHACHEEEDPHDVQTCHSFVLEVPAHLAHPVGAIYSGSTHVLQTLRAHNACHRHASPCKVHDATCTYTNTPS
jgi:hypothetical protein